MFNKIKIFINTEYSNRASFLKKITSVDQLFTQHLELSPEDYLLSIKTLRYILQNLTDSNKKIITIGMDLLKDFCLARLSCAEVDCLDIDFDSVTEANLVIRKLGMQNSIRYYCHDIREFQLNKKYSCGILTQMDYIFDDRELKDIFKKFHDAEIKNLVIISKSIYKFRLRDLFFEPVFNLIYSLKTFYDRNTNSYPTYRRRYGYFLSLLNQWYKLSISLEYKTKSGLVRVMSFVQK